MHAIPSNTHRPRFSRPALLLLFVGAALILARRSATLPKRELPPRVVGRMRLFVLAGQSNMVGRGALDVPSPEADDLFAFGNDYHWKLAREPLDDPEGQVDEVSRDSVYGYGPGCDFGAQLVRDGYGPVGLIPCARGGSRLAEWARDLRDTSLYGSMVKRACACAPMGRLAGLLWLQGEADGQRQEEAATYGARFRRFVTALRRDLGQPGLPIVLAQIAPDPHDPQFPAWETVRAQQAALEEVASGQWLVTRGEGTPSSPQATSHQSLATDPIAVIPTDGLPRLGDRGEAAMHFSRAAQQEIGRRFAAAWERLARPK